MNSNDIFKRLNLTPEKALAKKEEEEANQNAYEEEEKKLKSLKEEYQNLLSSLVREGLVSSNGDVLGRDVEKVKNFLTEKGYNLIGFLNSSEEFPFENFDVLTPNRDTILTVKKEAGQPGIKISSEYI